MENVKCSVISTLENEEAICQFCHICEPMFKTLLSPLTSQMQEIIHTVSEIIGQLKKENEWKDAQIRDIQHVLEVMTNRIDDLEQHGRKDSVRIFGLSESTPVSIDEKVLGLPHEAPATSLLGWDCSVS